MLRTPITLAAAGIAAALALSACGTAQLGAAAVTSDSRISAATLAAEVQDLNQAHQADKKVQLQFPSAQTPQVVLSWLLRFRIREQMAARYHLTVSAADAQRALDQASAQARQSGVTLQELAVANGVPPDQMSNLGRYLAIQNAVLDRMDGGHVPAGTAAQQALSNRFGVSQCRAAKDLGIKVNPQYGALDYNQIAIVATPDKLAAAPGAPSPSPSASSSPQLTPHC